MHRHDLEHIIRAAGAISGSSEFIILGSQAILGSCPEAPDELLTSQEVDLYPRDDPSKADLIDATIGELSPFHEQFGYYAHGVGPETAVLPAAWETRLVPVVNENTKGVTGLCLHPSDLAVSKLAAGRQRDIKFVRLLLKHAVVSEDEIRERAAGLPEPIAKSVSALLVDLLS
jgi:hypothetical protein